jgi:hypothetical protein
MNLKDVITLVQRSPEAAAFLKQELAKRVPAPVDMNARILARRPETAEQRADRLAGFMRSAARPVSQAPTEPRVAAAGEVAAPTSIVDRIRQPKQGA